MDNRHGKKTKFNQTLGQLGIRGTHIYIMSITWQVWQNGSIGKVEIKLSKNYKNGNFVSACNAENVKSID